jgi:putative hemolysin
MIFAEATRSGVIEEDERALMTSVMRLAERPVREVMTPRTELHWIERKASEAEIRAAIEDSPHSLLLVADGSVDRIVGVAKVRDVLSVLLRGRIMLTRLMKKPAIVPDQLDTMDALRVIQQAEVALALVHDEYGHLEGIVTPADLLAAIAGNFVGHGDEGDAPMIVEREDGSLLIAGALPADALGDRLAIDLPEDRDYATAAGYVLSVLHLPTEGEHFAEQGWRFEIVDMDGRKIDKVLVSRSRPRIPKSRAGRVERVRRSDSQASGEAHPHATMIARSPLAREGMGSGPASARCRTTKRKGRPRGPPFAVSVGRPKKIT